MLGEDSLRSIAEDLGIQAIWKDETGSTNRDAAAQADKGAPEFTVVAAGHQTEGRGRLGRTWSATPGSSLLVSVLLRPHVDPEDAGLVSLLPALHMLEACRGVFGLDVNLKWPNDLVVEERKLAGVLPEAKVRGSTIEHVVVGIGVNLRQRAEDFPRDVRARATSVVLELAEHDHEPSDEDERDLLFDYLAELLRFPPGAEGWKDVALQAGRDNCVTLARDVRATTTDGRTVEGLAVDLDERGALVIDTADGPQSVAFGEVQHLR